MKIRLTRASVCAADDCDAPHERSITVPTGTTVGELARKIQKEYIPGNIQGGKATWSLVTSVPVGVLAQQWAEPRILPFCDLDIEKLTAPDGSLKFHMNYHGQIDPEIVLEVLSELKLETIQQGGPFCGKRMKMVPCVIMVGLLCAAAMAQQTGDAPGAPPTNTMSVATVVSNVTETVQATHAEVVPGAKTHERIADRLRRDFVARRVAVTGQTNLVVDVNCGDPIYHVALQMAEGLITNLVLRVTPICAE